MNKHFFGITNFCKMSTDKSEKAMSTKWMRSHGGRLLNVRRSIDLKPVKRNKGYKFEEYVRFNKICCVEYIIIYVKSHYYCCQVILVACSAMALTSGKVLLRVQETVCLPFVRFAKVKSLLFMTEYFCTCSKSLENSISHCVSRTGAIGDQCLSEIW